MAEYGRCSPQSRRASVAGEQLGRRTSIFPQLAQLEGEKPYGLSCVSFEDVNVVRASRETRPVDKTTQVDPGALRFAFRGLIKC